MKTTTLLIAALACCSGAFAQQTVTLQSPKETYSVNSTAQAKVERNGPFLEVTLEKHLMWASKQYAETTRVISYSIGIAARNENGQWENKRNSKNVGMPFTIAKGESKQMPRQSLLVPIDGISNLQDHWLMLTMKLEAPDAHGGVGYTYAHSEKLTIR